MNNDTGLKGNSIAEVETTSNPKLQCLQCHKSFRGNDNKKFCNTNCKNTFHNARRKDETIEIGEVVNILKTNRRIILDLLKGREVWSVPQQKLLDKGFIFRYHTHRRVNKGDGSEYIFCFDSGYLQKDNGWYLILRAFKGQD